MLRHRKAVRTSSAILLAALSVSCNQNSFEATTPVKSKTVAKTTNDDDAKPSVITTPGELGITSMIPVKTICSDLLTRVNTTNLRLAESGVSVKLYLREGDMTSNVPALTVDDPTTMQHIRKEILNRRAFKFTTTKKLPDGVYDMLICDSKFGDQCSRNAGQEAIASGTKQGLYKNQSVGRPYGLGSLGYAPKVNVLNGQISVTAPMVVLANNNLGDTNQQSVFAQTFSQAYTGELGIPNNQSIASFYGANDASDVGECDQTSSPLVVDLSGKGIELSPPEDGVKFDIKGDGDRQQISWLKNPEQYFVVLDDVSNNSKGTAEIRSTLELFGNRTIGPDGKVAANGFEAIGKYDNNGDKRIDRKDSIFASLRLWNDSNRDGIGQESELVTFDQVGLVELDLNYVHSDERDLYGNEYRQKSRAKNASGRTFDLIDVWFQTL